ncbi:MAG: alpha-L-fucosidase [Bacteroidota bacterium]
MKKFYQSILTIIVTIIFCSEQTNSQNIVIINPTDTPEQIIEKAANVIPSPRQYEWQKLEMTGFIHFGINTFDEVEWGTRFTDITKFNPEEIDVNQWVKVFKEAGFKMIILTAKHHDGFCLWATKYTDYNISKTPFQNGNGDIVRDLSNACREAGIKFGVYLSPWDMHEKTYGTPEYNIYFMNQLTELLTNYGDIAEVWFDGACGEGPDGRKQIYDWNAYYELIRKLQPNAVIAVSGPDVRWVGTESGYGRQTEWSVLPGSSLDQKAIAEKSQQQVLDGAFIPRDLMDEDLGSRDKIKNSSSLIWYPAEVNVSIRPRWFYHANDDEMVKSPQKLVDIYFNSVGLNGVLLLNIPPDKRGLIHNNDIEALKGMRYILDETFNENLAANSKARATNELTGFEAKNILDGNPETYWTTTSNNSTFSIEIQMSRGKTFNCAMIQENILKGQRIEKFRLEYWDGQLWRTFARATTVGYKRLLRFPEINTDRIKIVIEQSRTNPTISSFGLYLTPPEINFESSNRAFEDSTLINISCNSKRVKIYYTLDGSTPDEKSKLYKNGIPISESSTITAIAVSSANKKSLPIKATFNKVKYSVKYNSAYDEKYSGGSNYTLIDGFNGSANFKDGMWQGFNGTNLDLIIDLKEVKNISNISAGFLQDINSFIFLPESVEFSFSEDGNVFSNTVIIKNDIPQNDKRELVERFNLTLNNIGGRFIHIKANNIGVCPEWHKGADEKAWLFCDEISVE